MDECYNKLKTEETITVYFRGIYFFNYLFFVYHSFVR